MSRRRIIVCVLLLACGVALVPLRQQVWDLLTLRTVEVYMDNGYLYRPQVRWWDEPEIANWTGRYEAFYPNGRKMVEGEERRGRRVGILRGWTNEGKLAKCISYVDGEPYNGIRGWARDHGENLHHQVRFYHGKVVEKRYSPPWF